MRRLLILSSALVVLAISCGDDSSPLSGIEVPEGGDGGGEQPGAVPAPTEAPAATDAPPTDATAPAQPETPTAEAPAGESEPLSTEEWVVVALLGVMALGVVIVVARLATRGSGRPVSTPAPFAAPSTLDSVARTCRSIHDSQVIGLLQITDPTLLRSSRASTRSQLVDVEAETAALGAGAGDPSAREAAGSLGGALAALRGSLDGYVGVQTSPTGAADSSLVDASRQTLPARRAEVENALQMVMRQRW